MITKVYELKVFGNDYFACISSNGTYTWNSDTPKAIPDQWKYENGAFYCRGGHYADSTWAVVGDHPIRHAFKDIMNIEAEKVLLK